MSILVFSIAIILMGKRELVPLLNLSPWCLVMVEWLFPAVPWGCLQFVIVVFPDHTYLLFLRTKNKNKKNALSCQMDLNPNRRKFLDPRMCRYPYGSFMTLFYYTNDILLRLTCENIKLPGGGLAVHLFNRG